jgi:D-arabinonate dehydratase
MQIEHVTVQRIRIPLPAPVSHPVKTLEWREHLLICVAGEDGHVGTGFCLQDVSAAPAQAAAVELLAPLVVGRDSEQIRELWELMYRQSVRAGRRGAVLHALSAIDIALWDLLGRRHGIALHHLLGGYRDSVPCYASGGYYYEQESLQRLEQEIGGYVESGFRAVKMKVGRLSVAAEAERVRVARQTVGPDRRLMIDANQAYRSVEDAAALCRRIEQYDIGWFEEPFSVDETESFLRLKRRTSIPLATGEVEATRWAFKELIRQGVVDYVQPDVTSCGGVTEWMHIASVASASGVPVAPHYHWDLHVQLACACPEVDMLEKFEGTAVKNFDLVLASPMAIDARGELRVPDGPGHAIEFDEQAVQRYLVSETTVRLVA